MAETASNVERLRVPTPEEALIYKRTTATDNTYSVIRDGGQSLKLLPHCLLRAFECEAWKQRRTPNGATVENANFLEWVTAAYPRGLGATPEVVEAILTSSREAAEAQEARLLWDRAVRGGHGGDRRHSDSKGDNITLERQGGTSIQAGLRRLDREAESGNGIAAEALSKVLAGELSVHAACVQSGLRKSTKIDRDVRDRAAQALAERIIANFPADELEAAKADAFASGARALGIALVNLAGESIMDRRHG